MTYANLLKPVLNNIIHDHPRFFKNLDIRALVGKNPNSEKNKSEWDLIFIRICFTNDDMAYLNQRYQEIKNIFNQDSNSDCILVTESVSFELLSDLMNAFESGRITIEGKNIFCNPDIRMRDLELNRYKDYFIDNSPYDYWVTGITTTQKTEAIAKSFGFKITETELDFSEINQLFEIPSKEWNQLSLQLLILIPLEIEILLAFCEIKKKNHVLHYLINKELCSNLKPLLRLINKKGEKILPLSGSVKTSKFEGKDGTMTEFTIIIDNINLNETTSISLRFVHLSLNEFVFEDTIYFSNKSLSTPTLQFNNNWDIVLNDLENNILGHEIEAIYNSDIPRIPEKSINIDAMIEKLNKMKEDQFIFYFCELLRKMGFRNVQKNKFHGKTEMGLDTQLFYYDSPFKKIEYYGLQAKAKAIHGNSYAEGNVSQVYSQIEMALFYEHVHIADERKKRVDYVILANSQSIDPEARRFLKEKMGNKIIILNDFEAAELFVDYGISLDD